MISRREFLKITAIAGGVAFAGSLISKLSDGKIVKVQETRVLMGTIINLTLITTNPVQGREAIEQSFAELERLVVIFDHRNSSSVLSILNSTGTLHQLSVKLLEVIKLSRRLGDITQGAFDITVKPLVDLYRQHQDRPLVLPGKDEIAAALDSVDYRKIGMSDSRLWLEQPGMAVTLDGIAIGYVVEAGVARLRDLGFEDVMVEAGGDLLAYGSKGDQSPWRIGVRNPRKDQQDILARFSVQNQAVATSGDYMQSYTSDFANHHIIDPRIGTSSPELASVTVVGKRAAVSDGLATALMVLGPEQGIGLLEQFQGYEGYLVDKQLNVFQTEGF